MEYSPEELLNAENIMVLEQYDPETGAWPIIKKFNTVEAYCDWMSEHADPNETYHAYSQSQSLKYPRNPRRDRELGLI